MNEEQIREIIREEMSKFNFSDRFVFYKLIQILDGRNIQFGLTNGTKLGLSANDKISLHGVTPVIQASAISAPSTPSGSYSQAEAQSAVNAINSIRTALINKGITA